MAKSKKSNVSSKDIMDLLNKEAGSTVAYSLKNENPTSVKYWIPTGSRWLDSITCKGQMGGIPGGKIASIAGLSGTGKSYLAVQIAANAINMGINVVYFDSEVAIDPDFLEKCGVDLDELTYVIPDSIEHVLESISTIMNSSNDRFLFIWDSLAFTESKKGLEEEIDPNSSVARNARILSKGFKRLMGPLAKNESTFLVLNQLKTRIGSTYAQQREIMSEPWTTPGGLSPKYSYSLEIWLTKRVAKSALKKDSEDTVVGAEVKAKIKKSRFGTQHRECVFDIEWGQETRICDEESWFDALLSSPRIKRNGSYYLFHIHPEKGKDGWSKNFYSSAWLEMLEDEEFRKAVLEAMDEHLIYKYIDNETNKEQYFNVDGEVEDEDNK